MATRENEDRLIMLRASGKPLGMKIFAVAAALVAISSPVCAENLRQFDLICAGERRIDEVDSSTTTSVSRHIRVDLDRREYCDEDCNSTRMISEITTRSIWFRDSTDVANPVGLLWSQFVVDRETGKYFDKRMFPNTPDSSEEGFCRPAAFSGLPVPSNNLF